MKNDVEGNGKYLGSVRAEMDHYFGHCIGTIMLRLDAMREGLSHAAQREDLLPLIEKFVRGMEKVLRQIEEGSLAVDEKLNARAIQELIDAAELISDPSDPQQIQRLIQKYNELKR